MAWTKIIKVQLLVQIIALSHAFVSALQVDVRRARHKVFHISAEPSTLAEQKRNHAFQKHAVFAFQPNLNLRGGDGVRIKPSMEKFGLANFVFLLPLFILSISRLSSSPVEGSTTLVWFLFTILSARFIWNWMTMRSLNVLSKLFLKRQSQAIQMYLAISSMAALLGCTALRTFFSEDSSLVSNSNGACVGFALALILWHYYCHADETHLVSFKIHRPNMNGFEYLLTMIGSSYSHVGWGHVLSNVFGLLLWQLRPSTSIDSWQQIWDSPLMFFLLFFGGSFAGKSAEILIAHAYKRQFHTHTASAADAAKQTMTCSSTMCTRIPGLAMVWNSVASIVASSKANLHTLPQRVGIHLRARTNSIGASDSVMAVAAAASVRCIAECVTHNGGALVTVRNLLPVALLAAEIAFDISCVHQLFSGGPGEIVIGDGIGHAAHMGGAAFGLTVAVLVPLAAAAAAASKHSTAHARAQSASESGPRAKGQGSAQPEPTATGRTGGPAKAKAGK